MVGGPDPPPPVFVYSDDFDFLSAGELDAIVSGSRAVVSCGCVVTWSPWSLEEGREGGREGGDKMRPII